MTPLFRLRTLATGALVSAAVLVGACGSSGPSASSATSAGSASSASSATSAGSANAPAAASRATGPLSRACRAVAAVLSDGPGPKEDPVGYAEAQIRALAEVRTGDRALRGDIQRLDRAYREVFESNDSPSAASEQKSASARLDAVCPGAAP